MTPEQAQVVRELRDAGYAMALFAPDELLGADPLLVEIRMTEYGLRMIPWLNGKGN